MVKKNISQRWTKEQLKLAFHLYCQLPFGKLDSRNPEVIELASLIGRTSSAVAMKLVNFASLDPVITESGRKGLSNASLLDKEVWDEFHSDWEGLASECATLNQKLRNERGQSEATFLDPSEKEELEEYLGETRQVLTEQRIKQHFFRRAVLSSYQGRCCMSGLSDPQLLVASHIVPWAKDHLNRLNPRNGLCLSAIHDRAFDKGLITLSDDFGVILSDSLKRSNDQFVKEVFLTLEGKSIELPERFSPIPEFVARHREEIFQKT